MTTSFDEIGIHFLNQNDSIIFVLKIDQQVPDWELASHRHSKNQLMMTNQGLITVETPFGIWAVPAQHGLWIPAETLHKVNSYGVSNGYVAFIEPDFDVFPKQICTMLSATNLLYALLERLEKLSESDFCERKSRLIQCLLDEIPLVGQSALYLPIPEDVRLTLLIEDLLQHPEQNLNLATWAQRCCLSERTLTRIFHQCTGMSINQWRRKLHVVLALQWLTEGDSVHQVAMKLGYDSDSSFILMFKKIMKLSPKNYIRQF